VGTALNKTLAAHQPNYLPWSGLFSKLAVASVWVVADDIQFAKHSFTNRNRIRTNEGWQWLTVPVRTGGRGAQEISAVEIDDSAPWRRKHLEALRWNYHAAPAFAEHESFLGKFFAREWTSLLDANLTLIRYLLDCFDINAEPVMSSSLDLREERSERLVDMVVACGCDSYVAGDGASEDYLDRRAFAEAGVELRFINFKHPTYDQCFPGFEPNMAAVDLLFNCGVQSREVLLGC